MSQKEDITFPASTTKVLALALENLDGTPFDLTDNTEIRFRVSPFPSGDAVLQLNKAAGVAVNGDPTDGEINVSIANTDLIDSGLFVYDVVVTIDGQEMTDAWQRSEGRMGNNRPMVTDGSFELLH